MEESNPEFEKIKRFCLEELPSPDRNYREIALKKLLDDENFVVTKDVIGECVRKLNPEGNPAYKEPKLGYKRAACEMIVEYLVKPARQGLVPIVKDQGDSYSLILSTSTKEEQVNELKSICGKAIANRHVTELMKEDNQYWFIQAGREDEQKIKLEKFRKGDYVAVDYYEDCDFDLSDMTRNEIDTKTGGNKVQELFNISQIKQGDFIAVVKGNKTVEEFAIATSDYYFVVSDTERDKHRVNVEYLNFGTTKFGKNWNAAIMQDTSGKIKNFLLGEKEPKYFLLRHNVKGPWKDDPGKKYHVGRESDGRMGKRVRQILDTGIGTKTVWYSTSKSKGGFYFWGYGTVTGIEEKKKDTDWYLTYNDFKFFEGDVDVQGRKLKRATESVNQQLQELQHDKEWKMNWQLSINPIPKKIYEEITGDRSTMSTSPKQDNGVDPRTIEILKRKMNIVLYGPPGTGKTYNAKKIAEKLISTNTPDAALCFPTDQGIDKITRFQKFLKDQDNKLVWGVGWLGAGQLNAADFPINGFIYYRQEIIAIARITKITSHDETTKEEQKLRPDNQEWKFYLHMDKLELCKPFSHKKLKLIDKTKPMPEVVQQRVYVEDYTKFRNQVTFHQSYGYEEFIEGIRPKSTKNGGITYPVEPGTFKKICDTARGSQNKFVLIIDEINRGNISKIFGELITIIENDKRGEPVILAYSGDSFSVPENVYVIGTMNTADQSIKFLDAALKRRFSSIELMPDPSILKDGMPGLSQLLIEINKRIVEKRTRDNQIGHSYFMNKEKAITDIEELQFVFATEIIPLLRDYFYDNEDDLQHVLGEQFIDWDEGSANVKDDWQNDKNKFRDAIKAAYNVKI